QQERVGFHHGVKRLLTGHHQLKFQAPQVGEFLKQFAVSGRDFRREGAYQAEAETRRIESSPANQAKCRHQGSNGTSSAVEATDVRNQAIRSRGNWLRSDGFFRVVTVPDNDGRSEERRGRER